MSVPDQLRSLLADDPAFAQVTAALDAGRRALVEGLPGGAESAFLAALAAERPLLVVLPTQDGLNELTDDVEALCPDDARVLRNPSLDLFEEADDDEVAPGSLIGARLHVLRALSERPPPAAVVTATTALLQRLPAPARGGLGAIDLAAGATLEPHELARSLVSVGHSRVALVESPGEFAIRGGIVDVFPFGSPAPVRIELFGDEVESLRHFEPGSQRSTGEIDRFSLSLVPAKDYVRLRRADGASVFDHLPAEAVVVLQDPVTVRRKLAEARDRFASHAADLLEVEALEQALASHPLVLLGEEAGEDPLAAQAARVAFPFQRADLLLGRELATVTSELARRVQQGDRVTVGCFNAAERERLHELFSKSGLEAELADGLRLADDAPGLSLVDWSFADGFHDPARSLCLLASHRLFARHRRGEVDVRRGRGRRRGSSAHAIESFADLEPGQAVVHVSYGVALFRGIVLRERDGQPREFLHLEFDGGDLFFPTDRIGLVRRYVGPTDKVPKLSKLGGKGWKKKTQKAQEAVRDLAAELIEVQAERRLRPGHAFPPDDRWQHLFEESFGYTDTDDQIRVTAEVKQDMELDSSMDRLVCGDVGYGKTEIAVRAAFKAATAGKQVAVLCPTTVLAHQHHKTFSERMAGYPLTLEVISRFRTPAEVREVLKDAKRGVVDVLIGTHRLLSKDVGFKDLGLVVVDEEQRFGVAHKEKLKALRRTVDLLTLSATPIPRTLHMALSGARDISTLQTPPPGRTPVETHIARFSRELVTRAIERELARDGQAFFVHDRVRTIGAVAKQIKEWVPTARVVVLHGQMHEETIEKRMLQFVEHEADVMVATTLIENGLDIRRANTLIVDRADRFGLAEMHQLRGRVGRSSVHAYAYFLLPEHGRPSEVARRRLRAIEEFSDLGAGFQIALRDLEIRGAGNVLGAEQSGHIADVGYDLYCRLLKRSMAELRGELEGKDLNLERDLDLEAGELEVVLDVAAYVPDAYVADVGLKIDCYRKLSSARHESELDELEQELRDRYGPLPDVLLNLSRLRRLRIRAAGRGVTKITRQDKVLQLRCRSLARLERAVREHHEQMRPIDEHMLYVVMHDHEADDEAQLAYLLEVFGPLNEDEVEEQPARPLDPQQLRKERQRRMRAKQYKRRRAKPASKPRSATSKPRGAAAKPRGAAAKPRGAAAKPRGAAAKPRGAASKSPQHRSKRP